MARKVCKYCGKRFVNGKNTQGFCNATCRSLEARKDLPPGFSDEELETINRIDAGTARAGDEARINARLRDICEQVQATWGPGRFKVVMQDKPVVIKAYESVIQGRGEHHALKCAGDAIWT